MGRAAKTGQNPILNKDSTYNKLMSYLEEDERIVWPEMYLKHRDLYDKICGIAYLVRYKDDPERNIEWVWENQIGKVMERAPIDILEKQLVVRVRLPWNEVDTEWLCSQYELDKIRDDVDILQVFLRVYDKVDKIERPVIDPLEYHLDMDRYERLEARYLVTWTMSPETEKRLLDITPDDYVSVMAE